MKTKDSNKMDLGRRIRLAMVEANLTQVELALKLHTSRSLVSHWIRNKRQPSYQTVQKLCTILNKPIAYFQDDVLKHVISHHEYDNTIQMPVFTSVPDGDYKKVHADAVISLPSLLTHGAKYAFIPDADRSRYAQAGDICYIRPEESPINGRVMFYTHGINYFIDEVKGTEKDFYLPCENGITQKYDKEIRILGTVTAVCKNLA